MQTRIVVLLDAKDWRRYPPINAPFWHEGTIEEILHQIGMAGDIPIEWHFSTEAAKQAVDLLLARRGYTGLITTVFTPYIR